MSSHDPLPLRDDDPTIGGRIKAVRQSWHWSQMELAEALKVDQASISFWERGKIIPSGSAMLALASLFRTSVEGLREGREFHMPECPSRRTSPREPQVPPRCVSLPMVGEANVMVVDLGNGTYGSKDLSEAVMGLAQGVSGNRKVWLVLA